MTRRFLDADAVRSALARRIGRQPDPLIWEQLVSDRWLGDFLCPDEEAPEASIDELVGRYRELHEFARRARDTSPAGAPRGPSIERRLPATRAVETQTRISAIEAADLPAVRAFRERVLGGRLLGWQEAREWLTRHFGERQKWRRIHLSPLQPRTSCARTNPWEAQQAVAWYEAGGHAEGGNESDTLLDYLYCLCDVLIDRYQWDDREEDVALFVLTGRPPSSSSGHFSYAPPPEGADLRNGTITMQVGARLGPRELMKLYSDFRRSLLDDDSRVREISDAVAALAVFAAAANDGRSWAEAMQRWNAEHPEGPTYAERRLFTRDCRKAYRRVMGRELRWRGAGGAGDVRGLQPAPELFAEIEREEWRLVEKMEARFAEDRARRCREQNQRKESQ